MERLSTESLADLADKVITPAYDRAALRPGILHLGLGAFHRAHQAVYTDTALRLGGGDWGIIGVCMRGDSVARQLRPQDLLYSVWSRGGDGDQLRVIGALTGVIVAPEEPAALDAAFADPGIRIVTLTVTEKGYCLDGDGLDTELPAVRADLAAPELARTAIGILARGLARRYDSGGAPLTVISCDNLAENGARLARALRSYAAIAWPHLLDWLDSSVRFPCSMVDRIVPAMDAAGRERQAQRLGLWDEAAVATEPFTQWIIEERFAAGVPDWAAAGVRLVADIRPYEAIKLRLLNAAHSAIAYAGLLAGLETVADVMADARLREFIERLMREELAPALVVPPGFDLDAYREQLLQRFANPHLQHRCAQIAMDGTEKIRQRWLPTLATLPADTLLLRALAAWCHYVLCTGLALEDPRSAALTQLRNSDAPLASRLADLLACLGLAATDIPAQMTTLLQHCQSLAEGGPDALLAIPEFTHKE
ncbi:mannitol dehydrogenase family protein [Haliea sp. E17]|uniref:mannitol dehydrogenase family protein n=1 Tax=Haliea sp. E17 TaxID=3401576 RepID=UPI003AAFDC2B